VRSCRAWFLALLVALLWLAWPFLRPRLWPAAGPTWLVVLDGYHRLDLALELQRRQRLPILLISCPATGQPTAAQWRRATAPLLVLPQGFDTATQMAALGRWWPQRQSSLRHDHPAALSPALSAALSATPAQVWLVSDPSHLPRARLAAQIALGAAGTRVRPQPAPFPGTSDSLAIVPDPLGDWPLWRDALRLQLWRLSGSTGSFLQPAVMKRKIFVCQDQATPSLPSLIP
jgi:hypothetical protein